MAPRTAGIAAFCLMIFALVACGTSHSKANAPATSTATARAPSSCGGYTKGHAGVINVFCGGPAKAVGTVGSTPFTLDGGYCVKDLTFMSVNVGVLVGPDYTGSLPDYFGIVLKPSAGAFSDASATIDTTGAPHAVTLSGSLDDDLKGGKFKGTDGSIQISGTFSC